MQSVSLKEDSFASEVVRSTDAGYWQSTGLYCRQVGQDGKREVKVPEGGNGDGKERGFLQLVSLKSPSVERCAN